MKYKRLLSAVIIVVLMLAFTGCNAGVISNAPPPASENTTVSDTTEKESETATSVSTSAASTGKPGIAPGFSHSSFSVVSSREDVKR